MRQSEKPRVLYEVLDEPEGLNLKELTFGDHRHFHMLLFASIMSSFETILMLGDSNSLFEYH